jgi:threonine aldolase
MDRIDLRSDTVTWPTEKMRQAMASAAVGDDVYGEDPTVNELEALAAERFGKEAGLLVTSGTMGNMVSLLAHCGRGEEAIMGNPSHTFLYEAGNPATLGGVHSMPVPVDAEGKMSLVDIKHAIRDDDPHFPRTKLISVENSQGSRGGQPLNTDYIDAVGTLARAHDIKLHIDGARIFNAAAAVGVDVARLTRSADSLTFCLSKGLCAPVGSVVVGSEAFIHEARRARKALGGGMRQAGMIAAAGIVALEDMTERLQDDHQNACRLAEGLAEIDAIDIDLAQVKTNMIFFSLRDDAPLSPSELADALAKDNIQVRGAYHKRSFRFVTHYWVTEEHIDLVLQRMRSLLA